MAWIAEDWRKLQLISAVFALPCVFLLIYLNESPRFLIQSRRMVEAKEAILRMHRIDGCYFIFCNLSLRIFLIKLLRRDFHDSLRFYSYFDFTKI